MKNEKKVMNLDIYDLVSKEEFDSIGNDDSVIEEVFEYSSEDSKETVASNDGSENLSALDKLKKDINELDADSVMNVVIEFGSDGGSDGK